MHHIHIARKRFCARRNIGAEMAQAHSLCMARHKTYLREWREYRGKTLVPVAEHLHITHGQLSRIERGLQPYNQELLEKLADLYMCDVVDLLIRDPSEPESMWTLWERAKPGERRQITAIADAVLKQAS